MALWESHLKPPLIGTEPASQERVERVVRFLLKAAVHEDVHDFSLLLVLQSKPMGTNGTEKLPPGTGGHKRRGASSHQAQVSRAKAALRSDTPHGWSGLSSRGSSDRRSPVY